MKTRENATYSHDRHLHYVFDDVDNDGPPSIECSLEPAFFCRVASSICKCIPTAMGPSVVGCFYKKKKQHKSIFSGYPIQPNHIVRMWLTTSAFFA
jgi:hypothetical protein